MTAYGTVETAVEAMKAGASDYVLKPFSMAEMNLVIRKELDVQRVRDENRTLREALGKRYHYQNIVAGSGKMQEVLALVERGMGRDDAYRVVQRLAQRALDEGTPLRELLAGDPSGEGLNLAAIFDYAPFVRYAHEIVDRLGAIA